MSLEKEVKEAVALLAKGYNLADLSGLSEEHMEALYALAYQYYEADNFQDAKNIFTSLCLYDTNNEKYYMGLAATLHSLGEYKNAADMYSVACVLSGLLNPEPMYFASICLLKNNQKEDAIVALESIDIMGREGNKLDISFKEKAKNLLSILTEEK